MNWSEDPHFPYRAVRILGVDLLFVMKKALLIIVILGLCSGAMTESKTKIVRLDPRMDALVPDNAIVEKLADGFTWVEGPVWKADEQALLFSDVGQNRILKWSAGNPVHVFLHRSGYTGLQLFSGREPGSNGLTLDHQGRLVFCQHGDRRISRLEPDGSRTILVDRYLGKRLNSPNDVVLKSNGDLYFTDPPFGLPQTFEDPGKELDFQGIYRLSKDGSSLNLLHKDLKGPNGIAFSPDEKKLYVSDPVLSAWLVFDVIQDGTLTNKRIFVDAKPQTPNGPGGPDGMKVDRNGNIFASGPGGVYIISPDADILGRIDLGVPVGNCAWGEEGSTLFITANTAVYRVRLHTRGAKG